MFGLLFEVPAMLARLCAEPNETERSHPPGLPAGGLGGDVGIWPEGPVTCWVSPAGQAACCCLLQTASQTVQYRAPA